MKETRRGKRRKRREEKRLKFTKPIEEIATLENFYKAAKLIIKLVSWKPSVQRFILSILFKIKKAKEIVLKGKEFRQGFICFNIRERGKSREIQSLHLMERFIQKWLCLFVLNPVFLKTVIKENSASQKQKGTLFAAQTFEKHIRKFLKKHENGYILLIDFKKYFGNIKHEPLIRFYEENVSDERLRTMLIKSITAYEEGLGLGSEISQFNAIIYINKIDHYIKQHFKYYGRYMDDSYIICEDKEKLKKFSEKLFRKYEELGIIINKKKTNIVPIKSHFTFLKTRYKVTDEKIYKKPSRSSITRARKRFKKMANLVNKGEMTQEEMHRAVVSWAGSMKHRHARRSVYKIKKEIKNALRLQHNERGICDGDSVRK